MINKKIEKFEDISVWEKSRDLTAEIYKVTNENNNFSGDFDLKSQIRRSAISIMSNIAEGFGRRSDKAFSNFLNISHGSAAEVQSQLYVALDLKYVENEKFKRLYGLSDEISRMIKSLEKYLKGRLKQV